MPVSHLSPLVRAGAGIKPLELRRRRRANGVTAASIPAGLPSKIALSSKECETCQVPLHTNILPVSSLPKPADAIEALKAKRPNLRME